MELNSSICVVALLLFAVSCGKPSDPAPHGARRPMGANPQGAAAAAGPVCESGLAAFTQFVHAPILRKACVECHDLDGIGPAHSVEDPVASYAAIKSYVSFSQPESSRIMQHVRTKHWANYDPKSEGVSEETMRAALRDWWEQGEKACPDSATAQSMALTIPSDLPMFPSGDFAKMEWAVDAWGAAFLGSRFQVEIQRLASPTATSKGAYLLRRPRLATPQGGVSVDGIQLFINGKLQNSANEWGRLEAQVQGHVPASLPSGADPFVLAPALSGQNLILIQDAAAGDTLSLALTGAQFGEAQACRALEVFTTKIQPAIKKNGCVGCHSSAASDRSLDGHLRFDLSGGDAKACAAVRERLSFARPEASPFMLIGFLEGNGHPPAISVSGDLGKSLREWSAAEKSNRELEP